jgi:Icc-related predicted phosphoesterase
MSKVRLVLVSDTHGHHHNLEVPDGDILIFAGDYAFEHHGQAEMSALIDFFSWLDGQPHKHKVMIAGNHDFAFEKSLSVVKMVMPPSIIYLEGGEETVEGLKIWGGPWTPRFFDWAFNVDRGEAIKRYWDCIPDDTDILVTHGPPYGLLDDTPLSGHVGCKELRDAVKRVNPKLHVYGHIHRWGGIGIQVNDTTYMNASVVDETYELVRSIPLTCDVEVE